MWVIQKIKNRVRRIKQLWGTAAGKRALWDKEYASGHWDHCDYTPNAPVYDFVHRYCQNGHILELGCGSGNTGNELDTNQYASYIGVDISDVAIEKATSRSVANGRTQNEYVHGDIVDYVPPRKCEVILFRESIYYIPENGIGAVLKRYASYLSERGVFIVQAASGVVPKRAKKLFSIIEQNFDVLEKMTPKNSSGFVVAFSPKCFLGDRASKRVSADRDIPKQTGFQFNG